MKIFLIAAFAALGVNAGGIETLEPINGDRKSTRLNSSHNS